MDKYELAGGIIFDTMIFSKKIIKKTSFFSMKLLLGGIMLSSGVLGYDYLQNGDIYKSHYDTNTASIYGGFSPFSSFSKSHTETMELLRTYRNISFDNFNKEVKKSKNEEPQVQIRNNLDSLIKLVEAYKTQEVTENNPSLIMFKDFTLALAYTKLAKKEIFDGNRELESLRVQIFHNTKNHYINYQKISQNASHEVTGFCNAGIIGALSCNMQNTYPLLEVYDKDIINNVSYYDIYNIGHDYKFFLSLITLSGERLRSKAQYSLDFDQIKKMTPDEIIKKNHYDS